PILSARSRPDLAGRAAGLAARPATARKLDFAPPDHSGAGRVCRLTLRRESNRPSGIRVTDCHARLAPLAGGLRRAGRRRPGHVQPADGDAWGASGRMRYAVAGKT